MSVADPGFSPGGCANSQNCYYFLNFCRKLHENERIWTRGGARVPGAPLGSANACRLITNNNVNVTLDGLHFCSFVCKLYASHFQNFDKQSSSGNTSLFIWFKNEKNETRTENTPGNAHLLSDHE